MEKLEALTKKIDELEENLDNSENWRIGLLVWLTIISAILIIVWIGLSVSSNNTSNYYDNKHSFCEYYSMTYNELVTPAGQRNKDLCVAINRDTVTGVKEIVQVNNRWVFKES